ARWNWLFQANRSVIKNPDMIFSGQVLSVTSKPPARATATAAAPARQTALTTSTTLSGTLSCPGLEELWEQAGGSQAEAVMAASIAMAESSGRQFATGAAGERGYWQIHPDHGSLSPYTPLGHPKAAGPRLAARPPPAGQRQAPPPHLRRRPQLDPLDHLHQRRLPRALLTNSGMY